MRLTSGITLINRVRSVSGQHIIVRSTSGVNLFDSVRLALK